MPRNQKLLKYRINQQRYYPLKEKCMKYLLDDDHAILRWFHFESNIIQNDNA